MLQQIIELYNDNAHIQDQYEYVANRYKKIFSRIGYKMTKYDRENLNIYFWLYTVPIFEILSSDKINEIQRSEAVLIQFYSGIFLRHFDNVIDRDCTALQHFKSSHLALVFHNELCAFQVGKPGVVSKLLNRYLDYERKSIKINSFEKVEHRVSLLFYVMECYSSHISKKAYNSYLNFIRYMLITHDYVDTHKDLDNRKITFFTSRLKNNSDVKDIYRITTNLLKAYRLEIKPVSYFFGKGFPIIQNELKKQMKAIKYF